jgi:hypothetical protein
MDEIDVPREWLQRKLSPRNREWAFAIAELNEHAVPGDEFWLFDEPVLPGINAGVIGVALVRNGEPVRAVLGGIH